MFYFTMKIYEGNVRIFIHMFINLSFHFMHRMIIVENCDKFLTSEMKRKKYIYLWLK